MVLSTPATLVAVTVLIVVANFIMVPASTRRETAATAALSAAGLAVVWGLAAATGALGGLP